MVHPTWLVVDLLDFLNFLNTENLEILDMSYRESCPLKLLAKKGVYPSILMPRNMGDAEVLECHFQSHNLVPVLGHYQVPSFIFANYLTSYQLRIGKDPRHSTLSCLASLKPTRRASYSAWLLVALNEKRMAYSTIIPSEFVRMSQAPLT